MANGFLKNKKGQVSIEFILIILIALIYIHAVIQPTVSISSQSTEDVTRLSQAKLAAQKLAAAVNQLEANQAEGKKTISLLVPEGSFIECAEDPTSPGQIDRITFSTTMSSLRNPPQCTDPCEYGCGTAGSGYEKECGGFIKLLGGANPTCTFGGTPLGRITADEGTGNIFTEVVVVKDDTGIRVNYAPQ